MPDDAVANTRPLADIQADIKKAHDDHTAHSSAATDAASLAKSLLQEWDDALNAAKAEVEAVRTDVLSWFQRLGQDVSDFFKKL